MMLRGRHRGLPYGLDRAINLPSDLVGEEEERYKDETSTSEGTGEREEEMEGEGKFARTRRMVKSLTQ